MSLPAGASTCLVTFGRALGALGTTASIKATLAVDRAVVWAATGEAIYPYPEPLEVGDGGELSLTVAHVDQPGFLDAAGNAITEFGYVLTADVRFGKYVQKVTKAFQVRVGQTVADLDLVPGTLVPAVAGPAPAVLSVAGITGVVTDVALRAALGVSSAAELATTFAATSAAAVVAQRDRRGQADREASRARALVDFPQTETVEDWVDLSDWLAAGVQIAGGKLYSAAGSTHSAQFPINLNKPFRARASIQYAAVSPGLLFLGVAADNVGAAPIGGKIIGIGVNTGTGKMMSWNRGTIVEAAGTVQPGAFLVTVIGDATSITFTFSSSSGFVEHRLRVLRSTFLSCDGLALWNSDAALTAGSYVGPVVSKVGAKVTPTDRRAEVAGPSVEWSPVNAQNVHIATPPTYDTRAPRPVLLFSHGSGGDELQPLVHFPQLYTELLSDGFVIASTNAHGNNWGNPAAQADLLDLYRYLRDTYTLGPVILWGNSMGGLASLNALASGAIPCAGWIGTQPVCDLDAIYAAGAFTADIRTAYGVNGTGTDYATKTLGANPMARKGSDFYGVPMRFYASPADTVVAKALHTDKMAAKVAPYAAESTVITTSGDHGDPSHWAAQRADLKAFITRCVAS